MKGPTSVTVRPLRSAPFVATFFLLTLLRLLAPPLSAFAESPASSLQEKTRKHWAFQPLPSNPTVPPQPNTPHWIDRFITATLQEHGLHPSPEAPPRVLIRRVALILTGLPPTREEIDAFLHDSPPGAYERMVDRYLQSPRFGERWAKHWLDAAGYADSNGYFNADTDRPLAYRYRDYVVRAFNLDKPFPRFIHEQLAGDELSSWKPGEDATPEIIELLEATHYLRNGQDGSGESDGNPDEVRVDRYYALESSLQIIGSSLLGMTIQCAKCHDHKFEPFTQQDYYSLQAFLYPAFHIDQWQKPNDRIIQAALPGEKQAWEQREQKLNSQETELLQNHKAWVATHRPPGKRIFHDDFQDTNSLPQRWSATAPDDDSPGGSPTVQLLSNQAPAAQIINGQLQIIEGGGSGDRWISTRTAFDWLPPQTGQWIQVTFDLIQNRLHDQGTPAERIGYFLALHDFNDNSPTPYGNILIDGHPTGPTAVQVDYPGTDAKSRGNVGSQGYRPGHQYGIRVERLSEKEASLQHVVDGADDGPPLKLKAKDLTRGGFGFEYCCGRSFVVDHVTIETSDPDNPTWAAQYAAFQNEMKERTKTLESALKEIKDQRTPKPGRIAWTSSMSEVVPKVPLLKRGNPKTPGDEMPPVYPAFLSRSHASQVAPPDVSKNAGRRKALAAWLTEPGSPQNGLLARVAVNRIWQHCFGVGLVRTPDNLGLSGSAPTHPALTDALAVHWAQSHWSTKALLRSILTSHTFKQSSAPSPQSLQRDPDNQWLWRYPMHRLEAEAVRDSILLVSGKLGPKASGPYVPTPRASNGEVIVDEKNPEAFSRSIFLQQRRTQVPTFLGVFDAPSIVFNCTRRATTTMPLQSLSLLNSDFAVLRGRDFATRIHQKTGSDWTTATRTAFEEICSRPPTPEEEATALQFLRDQKEIYIQSGTAAPEAPVQAWNDLCHSLFALNAFLYVE